jgi:biotin operon repressor
MENCVLAVQVRQLRLYGLGPLDLLVFNIVAVASVQRTIRNVRKMDHSTADISPTNELNGTISRRRIADSTGISRGTVARSLARLMKKGLVVERSRGRLQVPTGIILRGQYACDPDELYAPVLGMMEQFLRLGVVRLHDKPIEDHPVAGVEATPVA